MDYFVQSFLASNTGMEFLIESFKNFTWQQGVMIVLGIIFILLAIIKKIEPALLLPMGFGAILVNMPFTAVLGENGIIEWLFDKAIGASEIMPLLLFIGIGAMIDFGPLLSNPKLFLFGAVAQFGIFATIAIAAASGYSLGDSAAIGVLGAADGPTAIFVATQLASDKIAGPVMVVAYSYMALVPIIQPAVIKLVTTKKERAIVMEYNPRSVSKKAKIAFPIIVTIVAGLLAPMSTGLVGFLMFGNLIRECGVLDNLSDTAQNSLANLVTLLLGITISFKMVAENFVTTDTLVVMGFGLLAFIFDTLAGVLTAKFINIFSKKKINPMIGAAGISAFPMSARVVAKLGTKENPQNYLLMHAVGCNVSGQIASAIAGGIILTIAQGMI